jgi:hypothetical protein
MNDTMPRTLFVVALLVAPLGCGGSGNNVWVTGKLFKGGARYDVPKDQAVTVTFVALEVQDASGKTVQASEPYLAELDPNSGTFTVPGLEQRGIPPGKYRVAVTQKLKRESFDAVKKQSKNKALTRETDMLGNRFGLETSPILREIPKSTDLVIDLDKPSES